MNIKDNRLIIPATWWILDRQLYITAYSPPKISPRFHKIFRGRHGLEPLSSTIKLPIRGTDGQVCYTWICHCYKNVKVIFCYALTNISDQRIITHNIYFFISIFVFWSLDHHKKYNYKPNSGSLISFDSPYI